MSTRKYSVSHYLELMRQGMIATGHHVKFSNDPKHVPDYSLEAQTAKSLPKFPKRLRRSNRRTT